MPHLLFHENNILVSTDFRYLLEGQEDMSFFRISFPRLGEELYPNAIIQPLVRESEHKPFGVRNSGLDLTPPG